MAVKLNTQAGRCEAMALAAGELSPESSATVSLYEISRQWRAMLEATRFRSVSLPKWSEKEVAAARVLIATLIYLKRIGCSNIEQLLADAIEQKSSTQNYSVND